MSVVLRVGEAFEARRAERLVRRLVEAGLDEAGARAWQASTVRTRNFGEPRMSKRKVEHLWTLMESLRGWGVSMASVSAVGRAGSAQSMSWLTFSLMGHDMESLGQVMAGRGLHEWSPVVPAHLPPEIRWCLVAEYAAFIAAGWTPGSSRECVARGLRLEQAERIASGLPGGRHDVARVWARLGGAVGWSLDELGAWACSAGAATLDLAVVARWHEVGVSDAAVLYAAGVSVDEYVADPARFADRQTVAMLAALRVPAA